MSQAPLLQDFVAEMQKGVARSNRYFVVMPNRNNSSSYTSGNKLLGLYCENTQIPGSTILTSPSKIFGETREVPYERSYEPINMSFYVDSDFKVKEYFDDWHNSIFDPYTRAGNYYEEYVSNIELWVHNVEDKRTYALTLFECYPKAISPIQLDYGSKELMKLQVTMQYKYWRAVAGEAAASESALANIDNPPVLADGDVFAALDMDNILGNLVTNYFQDSGMSSYVNQFNSFQDSFNSFAKDPVGSYLGGSLGGGFSFG
jgi:hypothetical protein